MSEPEEIGGQESLPIAQPADPVLEPANAMQWSREKRPCRFCLWSRDSRSSGPG